MMLRVYLVILWGWSVSAVKVKIESDTQAVLALLNRPANTTDSQLL